MKCCFQKFPKSGENANSRGEPTARRWFSGLSLYVIVLWVKSMAGDGKPSAHPLESDHSWLTEPLAEALYMKYIVWKGRYASVHTRASVHTFPFLLGSSESARRNGSLCSSCIIYSVDSTDGPRWPQQALNTMVSCLYHLHMSLFLDPRQSDSFIMMHPASLVPARHYF